MRLRAEVESFAIEGGGGHETIVEFIGGDDLHVGSGLDDEGASLFAAEVEVAIGVYAGGGEGFFEGQVGFDFSSGSIDLA